MRRLLSTLLLLTLQCSTSEATFMSDFDEIPDDPIDESELVENGAPGGESIDDGWSSSGTLTAGDTDSAVQLQANFDTPGAYTVQFSVSEYDPATDFPLPIAEVIWSVEGNYVRRVISVSNGISISGVGQGVKVVVRDGAFPTAPANDYVVGIQVAPGTRPAEQQPPSFAPLCAGTDAVLRPGVLLVAAGAIITVPIPQNIGAISLYTTAGSTTPVILTEADIQIHQGYTGGVGVKSYDPRIAQWVPLAPMATELVFYNLSAVTVLFSLTFGIDG